MKKQFIAEAARMQKLAGITEAKVVPVPLDNDRIYILYTYNVEYDDESTGYLYQLVDEETEETVDEDWWSDIYFLGYGEDNDPQVFPGEDFEDVELGSSTEQEISKREAAKLYKDLTGITEAKVVPSNTVPSNKNFINIQDIKDEMKDFYSLDVSNSDVKDWLQSYHYDRIEDDPDYDGDFVFDTTEREDFFIYLKDR